MIILATVIIISLTSNNIIDKANTAVTETNLKTIEEAANIALGEILLEKSTTGDTTEPTLKDITDKMKEKGIDLTGVTITYNEETGKITVSGGSNGGVNTDWVIAIVPEETDNGGDLYALVYIGNSTSVTVPCNITMVVNIVDPEELTLTGETLTLNIGTDYSNINGFESMISFSDESNITNITVPEGSNYLSQRGAFDGFSNLQQISLPEDLTEIGKEAFYNCSSLTSITIPGSVTTIGSSAFLGCSSLTSIIIPGSVTSIGVGAFSSSLTSIIVKNKTLTDIAGLGWPDGWNGSCVNGSESGSDVVYTP